MAVGGREESADRPRSTRLGLRTWRGCIVGQRGARPTPQHWPAFDRTNATTGRRHGTRKVAITSFESRGVRAARFSARSISADRPRSTRLGGVPTWRGCIVGQPGCTHPHTASRDPLGPNRTNTLAGRRHETRKVLTIAAESRDSRSSFFLPRGVSADCHGPRSTRLGAVRIWRGCVVGQHGARSFLRRRQRLDRTNTAKGRWHGFGRSRSPRLILWRAGRTLFAPWRVGRPPAEHAPWRSAFMNV